MSSQDITTSHRIHVVWKIQCTLKYRDQSWNFWIRPRNRYCNRYYNRCFLFQSVSYWSSHLFYSANNLRFVKFS